MNRLALFVLCGLVLGGCEDVPEEVPLGECPTDQEFFAALIDPWVGARCASCHTTDGTASESGFFLDGELDSRFAAFAALADSTVNDSPLLLLKPTDTHPEGHGGGQVLTSSSPEYTELVAFVGRLRDEIDDCGDGVTVGAPGIDDCEAPEPGPRVLRRLSHVEYGNTVRELLGLTSRPELGFATDDEVDGYLNAAGALDIPPLLLEQYRGAAEELSDAAVAQRFDDLMPCEETSTACAAEFVEEFGRRAWRRPLTEDDRDRYIGIFAAAAEDQGFRAGIRWVIAGLLQSPHFLYRSELGQEGSDGFTLSDWELATELSYLILQNTPDDVLLDAAQAGELSTPAGLLDQLERLAAVDGAARTMEQFVGHWLLLDRLPFVARDPQVFPSFTSEVRAAMAGETDQMVRDTLAQGGGLTELLRSDVTFLTPELAAFYDIPLGDGPADAEGFVRTDVDGTGRGGLLTAGALLTVHALPTGSSPIHRGVLVRERLLCQDLPPPPANVDASPPPVDPDLSTRERYAAHSDVPECASCHSMIDPIGFAFEHFDGVGRWRDTEGPHTIDATGEVVGSPSSDGTFDGVQELQDHLAGAEDVEACYAEQWLRFGTGMGEELVCSTSPLADAVAAAGGRLDAVYSGIAGLPHFRTRVGEPGELDAPDVGPGSLPALDDDTEFPDEGGNEGGGTPGLSTSMSVDDWGTGYCANVDVSNGGTEAVVWEVVLPFDGAVINVWNAVMTDLGGGQYSFVGVEWNTSLPAGGTVGFGLCANR